MARAIQLFAIFLLAALSKRARGQLKLFSGYRINGGNLIPGANVLDTCLSACSLSTTCRGIDFTPNNCRHHTVDTECRNKLIRDRTTAHFRLYPCEVGNFLGQTPIFLNSRVSRGAVVRGINNLLFCISLCQLHPACGGVDYNYSAKICWHHRYRSECNPFIADLGVNHFRMTVCESLTTPPGQRPTTTARPTTESFNRQIAGGFFPPFNRNRQLIQAAGLGELGTTPPLLGQTTRFGQTTTTTPTTTTTAPKITEFGVCPSVYQKYRKSLQYGGIDVKTANTAEDCKRACLQTESCRAVDFNNQFVLGTRCFMHTKVRPSDYRDGNADCCDQYRKLNCDPPSCYVHDKIDVTALFSNPPQPDDLLIYRAVLNLGVSDKFKSYTIERCSGRCVTRARYTKNAQGEPDLTNKEFFLERFCKNETSTLSDTRNCAESRQGGSNATVETCSCTGHLCNAISPYSQRSVAAYYPLDRHPRDLSLDGRAGVPVNLRFSSAHLRRNWSADFTEGGSFEATGFKNVLLGAVRDGIVYPQFTIVFWMKRTQKIGNMIIVNNGEINNAPLEMVSFEVNNTHHELSAKLRISGIPHTVIARVPLNEWIFLALTVTDAPILPPTTIPNPNYYVQLFLDGTVKTVFKDTGIRRTEAGSTLQTVGNQRGRLINVSNHPLCFGRPCDGGTPDNYFKGYIDEIRLFFDSIDKDTLDTLKMISVEP